MQHVVMYGTAACPYCVAARRLLGAKRVAFEDIRVDVEPARRDEMRRRGGGHTVPQIWIGDRHVGGCDDLHELERTGRLDPMLQGTSP
jgi:glutaredoxin 3